MSKSDHIASPSRSIAVVGMGCRFAGGVASPDDLWRLLSQGRHGIVRVPAERWSEDEWYNPERDHPGTMNMRHAGFLEQDIHEWDAGFFGIAPREAEIMDPQHRLFMEVAHEALEDAGIIPTSLSGTRTGIFAGVYNSNYSMMARGAPDPEMINGWSATGGHASVLAGRLAYYLGTKGPAMVVDTACSSSLVAVHLAVQSLRSGECDVALVGGAHLLIAPEPLVASTKLGATSSDGRCKVFDAGADGFGHGEGAGVLVLKRLSEANADGDRISAVIKGTAVNQDGRSNSLTAPNGPSQEGVVADALADADVTADKIGYVEAHGTGTPLGDPIEVEALSNVLAAERKNPLLIGSLKANIGHTEAAAGIAGLIKSILVVENGCVPPQPFFETLNPEIANLDTPIDIPAVPVRLDCIDGKRTAGVSAFGFAGTNAHVIVESYHRPATSDKSADSSKRVLAVSARSPASLATSVQQWKACLDSTAEEFSDMAFTSTAGRRSSSHRVAVSATGSHEALVALEAVEARHASKPPRIAFLFTGQGSQYAGMCQDLYNSQPVFRDALNRSAEILDCILEIDTLGVLFGSDPIDSTDMAQPLLVAVELALAAFWRTLGIEPTVVMGHSVGEYSAAVIAGAFTAEEALHLIAERGRAMKALPAGGGMMAVFCGSETVEPYIRKTDGVLAIAALNAPNNTVISGQSDALERLRASLEGDGIDCHPLPVSHAFHSPLMQPCLDRLQVAAGILGTRKPRLPLISNLTGGPVDQLDGDYWLAHAMQPVRFAESLARLDQFEIDVVLEIGPDTVLATLAKMNSISALSIGSLRRGIKDEDSVSDAACALFMSGADLNWRELYAGSPARTVRAPLTPFDRTKHWLQIPSRSQVGSRPPPPDNQIPKTTEHGSSIVYDFYDELTVLSDNYNNNTEDETTSEEGHLTFGFLPEPDPDFSWVRALFEKEKYPEGHERVRQTQRALKDALFADIDFGKIQTVFDYGCGHAADLASMVLEYPHLTGCGYTLSGGQVEVGRKRLKSMGLENRVRVERADSSKTPFARRSDLIFGVEVTGLIADKEGLFANVAASLTQGGLLVIADFVATGEAIANPETHSYTPNASDWAEMLGRQKLRLVRATDASREVANWLDDPNFENAVDRLVETYALSELTKRHLLSNGNIGRALRADMMRYYLLRAIASPHETVEAVTAANLLALQSADRPQMPVEKPACADWYYRIENLPTGIKPLLDPENIAASITNTLADETARLANFKNVGAVINDLAKRYAKNAFIALGATSPGELASLPIKPEHRRLVDHLAMQLASDNGSFEACENLAERHKDTLLKHPEATAELSLLGRCGPALSDVLVGKVDPLDLLFPGGDASLAEALYEQSPFSSAVQRLAAAACESLPDARPVNVIEIGGGTGATTSHILTRLPDASSYLFTDLSPSLVARSEIHFACPTMHRAILDIEKPVSAQNIAAGNFDMVVAANVLHATGDLAAVLSNVKSLLCPDGLLMMVENTGDFLWGDLTFGLTPGMWAFNEEPGRHHALLSQDKWRHHLEAAGFDSIQILDPGHDGLAGISQQCLILARNTSARHFAMTGLRSEISLGLEKTLRAEGHKVSQIDGKLADGVTDLICMEGVEKEKPAADILTCVHARIVQTATQSRSLPHVVFVTSKTPDSAVLTGFARGVAAELPETLCRTIELDGSGSDPEQAGQLATAILTTRGPVRLEGDAMTAPQLTSAPISKLEIPEFDSKASYLVTGAYGGLGPHLVVWLHRHGARHFVLAGRRKPSDDIVELLKGIDVRSEVADISDKTAVKRLVDLSSSAGPLKGVFHAAGALCDGALLQQTAEGLVVPLQSKFAGAKLLDRMTRTQDLDHFVLFSSAAGLLAPFGQANHAAANTALDSLAHKRRHDGFPALSVDWGAFDLAGAAMQPGIAEKVSATGLTFMEPYAAFDALGHALACNETQVAILGADWNRYLGRYPLGGKPFLLQNLDTEGVRTEGAEQAVSTDNPSSPGSNLNWREQLKQANNGQRFEKLTDLIRAEAAIILGLSGTKLDDSKPLREAGLDSLMSIELRNTLSAAVSSNLGATLVFDYPSINALAMHFKDTRLNDLFETEKPFGKDPAEDISDLASLNADELSAILALELGDDGG